MKAKNYKLLHKANLQLFLYISFYSLTTISQNLSFKEANKLMLINNGEVKASNFEVKSAQEELKASKGLRFPTVGISGTYLHLDNNIAMNLNDERNLVGSLLQIPNPEAVLGDWNFNLIDQNLGFASAKISIPIFAGGKINIANKASDIKLKLTETKHQIKTNDLTVNLIDYYYKLKLAIEAEKLRQEVYNVILLHNNQAEKFYKNGFIPEVETLNAKVALAKANRELLAAKKDVALATTALQNLIGYDKEIIPSSEFLTPKIIEPISEFKNEMLNKNLQLDLIKKNQKLAEANVAVEASEYFPKIGLQGNYSVWKDNLPLFNTKWFVGVGMEWELFNGLQREHKIKAAKYKISQIEEFDTQMRLNLETYTEKLYNEIQKELEQLESLQADEAFTEKLKFMRTRSFEEGSGTSLEVIDATLKLSALKMEKLKALYNYTIAYGELMVLTGKTDNVLIQN